MTLSELIESLETVKYESGGDPDVPFAGAYWDGVSVTFVADPEQVSAGMESGGEAVEAVARSMFEAVHELDWLHAEGPMRAEWLDRGHAALEAARPFMTSRPALDRDAVLKAVRKFKVAPRGSHNRIEAAEARTQLIDAVVALAVPVPTREQIDEVIATKVMRYDSAADVRLVDDGDVEALDAGTDAVLALLNGSADR